MLTDCNLSVFIPTVDAERARRFYQEILGLTLLEDNGFSIVFDAPRGTVRLARVDQFTPFTFTLLGWETRDLASEIRRLSAAGVTFEQYPYFDQDDLGVWTTPDGAKVAWFKDPDGNLLSLAQPAA